MGITPENGWSEATAYDFDKAVRMLGKTFEGKLQETERVAVPNDQEKPPDGHHWEHRPKYTLLELLAGPASGVDPDLDDGDDVFAELDVARL